MSRAVLSASLIFVWLAVSGLADLRNVDFDSYRQAHETAKADLATRIEPSEIADDVKFIPSIPLHSFSTFHPAFFTSLQWFSQETVLLREDSKIYKLLGTFLI